MSPRVVVVGAGAAGLAAFHTLAADGCEVHLFDAGEPGGLMRTERHGPWTVETGAHTVVSNDPDVQRLIASLGMDGDMVRVPADARRRFVTFRGAAVPVPMSAGELVASPLLTVPGRLRLLKEPFISAGGRDDESIHAFATRRFGAQVADRLIDPIVSSSTGGDSHTLLAGALFPRHVEFERNGGSVLKGAMRAGMQARRTGGRDQRGAWSHRDGISGFVRAILTGVAGHVHRVAVTHIDVQPSGVVLRAGDDTLHADAVVLAIPPAHLAAMSITGVEASRIAQLGEMPHASVITVSLGYRRQQVRHALDGTSLLKSSGVQSAVLTTFFASSMFAGRAPEGHVLLTSIVGGSRHGEVLALDDAMTRDKVHQELVSVLGIAGEPVFDRITRWPHAMPQPVAGHFDRLAAADRIEQQGPRIALAGGWRGGMSVGEALASGIRAARRVRTAV